MGASCSDCSCSIGSRSARLEYQFDVLENTHYATPCALRQVAFKLLQLHPYWGSLPAEKPCSSQEPVNACPHDPVLELHLVVAQPLLRCALVLVWHIRSTHLMFFVLYAKLTFCYFNAVIIFCLLGFPLCLLWDGRANDTVPIHNYSPS